MNHFKLKKLIENSHLTVKKIEEDAGLAPRSIFPILNGQVKNPREATLRGIAKSLGYTYEELLEQVNGEEEASAWNPELYLQVVQVVAETLAAHQAETMPYKAVCDIIDELYHYSFQTHKVDKDAAEMLIRIMMKSQQ